MRGSLARSVRDASPPPPGRRRPRLLRGICHRRDVAAPPLDPARGTAAGRAPPAATRPRRRRWPRLFRGICRRLAFAAQPRNLSTLLAGAGSALLLRRRLVVAAASRAAAQQPLDPQAACTAARGQGVGARSATRRRRRPRAAAGCAAARQPLDPSCAAGWGPGARSSRGDSSSPPLAAPPPSSCSTLFTRRRGGSVHASPGPAAGDSSSPPLVAPSPSVTRPELLCSPQLPECSPGSIIGPASQAYALAMSCAICSCRITRRHSHRVERYHLQDHN